MYLFEEQNISLLVPLRGSQPCCDEGVCITQWSYEPHATGQGHPRWIYHSEEFWQEFRRISRGYKKAFFYEQCKEIDRKNRMQKIRDLLKKIGDVKGEFHARRWAQ